MNEIVEKEKNWHNNRFSKEIDLRKKLSKYYKVTVNAQEYMNNLVYKYLKSDKTMRVLEYGCGIGNNINRFLGIKNIKLYGIDISEKAIKKAIEESKKREIDINFYIMNAENTNFENNFFDIIIGNGILHHLNTDKAIYELNRILKYNGHAVFFEPLGHNPIINLYRKLTPNLRTEDEHPLMVKDFKIMEKYFEIDVKYYGLTSIVALLFEKTSFFEKVYQFLEKVDSFIFNLFPYIKKYAWIVVIDLVIDLKKGSGDENKPISN